MWFGVASTLHWPACGASLKVRRVQHEYLLSPGHVLRLGVIGEPRRRGKIGRGTLAQGGIADQLRRLGLGDDVGQQTSKRVVRAWSHNEDGSCGVPDRGSC